MAISKNLLVNAADFDENFEKIRPVAKDESLCVLDADSTIHVEDAKDE